jgi:GTP pyrophosphokinase
MYQSLHTTVIGPNAQPIEIQIRTHEMHRVAEEGIASHWRYKKGQDLQVTDMQRFAWLRQLLEWQQNLSDPQEFLHSIKEDLFPDEVYVFTPNGDVQSFPKGATVVDFAYRIHSDIGQHCSGARVNGRLVPFKYILRSGDTAEIITTQEQTPSRDWLKVVKTPRAKSRIRAWMASQQRERSVALGREILEGDFNRHELDYQDLQARGTIDALGKELGVKNEEGLLASVGYGKVMSGQVLARLLPAEKLQGDKKQLEGGLERLFRLVGSRDRGVRVKGIEDVLVRFARCCHPLPGEEIAGIITRGRGVTVHVANCPTGLEADPERRVEVNWSEDAQTPRGVKIEVSCADEPGLLAAISSAISEAGVNIARAHIRTFDDKAVNTFEIMIGSSDQLRQVLQDISRVKGVYKANRVQG